ncbi:protein rolling stone-like [Amphiura filiformis]|uniref:protein rolling stone-like n=1 Tax=Amphiura filiformis TaxID=82378 RepID=UPI003B21DFDB
MSTRITPVTSCSETEPLLVKSEFNMPGCRCRRPRCRDFGLGASEAGFFTRPLSQCCYDIIFFRILWYIYRLILPVIYITYLIWFWGFFNGVGAKAILFLTTWSVLGFTLYVIVAAGNVVWDRMCTCARDGAMYESDEPDMGVHHMFQWFLFNIFVNAEIIVAVVYWTIIHDGINDTEEWIHDITAHLAPAIFSLIDVFFSATPVRVLHFIYPLGYGVTYFIFAVIYWAAGGRGAGRNDDGTYTNYIYSFLDFEENLPMAMGFLVIMMITCMIVHLLIWGVYHLKKCLTRDTDERNDQTANSEFTMVKTNSHSIDDIRV